jgi:mono/diheme cytochrome c family protein
MKQVSARLVVAIVLIFAAGTTVAQEPAGSSSWTRTTPRSQGEPKGYVQFQNYCSMCHGEGPGQPGTMALQAKYKGAQPALLSQRTDLTPQLIKLYVRNGISIMPIFRKTEISDADLDLIADYLTRNNKK